MSDENKTTDGSYWELIKLAKESQKDIHAGGACPNCGYCPHCGRGGAHPAPYYPAPYYPGPYTAPYPWPQPYTITLDSGTSPATWTKTIC